MAELKYSAKFDKMFNYTRKICEIIGIDIIKTDYKISWRTACLFTLAIGGVVLCLYTMYIDTVLNGNYDYIFKSGCIIGTGIQGISKATTGLLEQENLRFLYDEVKDIYETYEVNTEMHVFLKSSISLVKKLMGITALIITVTCIIIVAFPAFMFIIWGVRLEVLPFMIPFLTTDTDFGFYFVNSLHVTCLFLAGFGNLISDSWLFVYVAHVPLMKNILKYKFNELDEIVNKNPRDAAKSQRKLCEIFKWHQRYNIFRDTIKNTFFWIIFVQISTQFFGIACTIVCTFLGIWPPATIFGFYLYSLTFSYCSLGNIVESANDDICDMIYDCCWYHLTVPEQKMVMIMLRDSQNTSSLSIGGVAPLSLNTALQMTKTIYTLSMMLKEFFN